MKLAEAFLFNGRTMLPGGKTLSYDDVSVLQRKYPAVILKIGDPILDSVVTFEDDSREREIAHAITQKVASVMSEVQTKFTQRANLGSIDFLSMHRTVTGVVEYLKENPVSAALINRNGAAGSYLSEHAGNVFYLTMVLGSAVRDYVMRERMRQTSAANLSSALAMDLLPLGLGAMFLDIAMVPLEHLFAPGYRLLDEDRQAILKHPADGADLLPDSMPAATKMIVRTHHENFDGTGYPHHAPGSSLHVFSRIVRICDAFDAATSEKLYQHAKSPARVLWEMSTGPYRKCYDPVLMKVFCGIIQPFPIGAKLLLEDGRAAVVVRYNRKAPFQPSAVIAFDENGQRLSADQLVGPVNIGDNNSLRLRSFGSENLSFVYEAMEPNPAATGSFAFHEIVDAAYP
jgi:HD-GYP domain-containing protein (c-di-GMP phosphodiesterase class II)